MGRIQGFPTQSAGGGGSSNSFETIQPISGTSPQASSSTDTLTFISSDNSIGISGNSATDTLDFTVLAGGSSMTEYIEQDPKGITIIGPMNMAIAGSSPLSNVAGVIDDDNVALRATRKGELFTKINDTVTTVGATNVALSDGLVPTDVPPVGAFLMGNKSGAPSQWARLKCAPDNADGIGTDATGHLQILSHLLVFNGASWDRVYGNATFGVKTQLTQDVGVTGSVGVTFGSVGVTFPLVGITGSVGVTFGSVGVTFPLVGITGSVGVTFPLVGITGSVGVTFPLVGITGSVGVTFGTASVTQGGTFIVALGTPLNQTFGPTTAINTTLSSTLVVKASAGKLFTVTGYNSSTSQQFIQLHNSTTIPADNTKAVLFFVVPPTSNFALDFGLYGLPFSTGIALCNSSLGLTKAIGAVDCFFNTTYI